MFLVKYFHILYPYTVHVRILIQLESFTVLFCKPVRAHRDDPEQLESEVRQEVCHGLLFRDVAEDEVLRL